MKTKISKKSQIEANGVNGHAKKLELVQEVPSIVEVGEDFTPYTITKEDLLVASNMSREEARLVVDFYYSVQKNRIRASNKKSAVDRNVDIAINPAFLKRCMEDEQEIEKKIAKTMLAFARGKELGQWAMSIKGISGILASALLAYIDISRARTAGAIWKIAGL